MRHAIRRRGAAAVELALVLPFLVVMFAGVVDFARVFHATQVLDSSASVGATYASGTARGPGSPQANADVARTAVVLEGVQLCPAILPEQVTVNIASQTATVTVEHDFPLLTGFLMTDGTVKLRRTAVVPIAPRTGE